MSSHSSSSKNLPIGKSRSRRRKLKPSKFDLLALVILTAVVVVTPWFFGGVSKSTQVWMWGGVLASVLVFWTGLSFGNRIQARFPLAFLPVLLGIGLGALQLVQLPTSVARIVAPKQLEHRANIAGTIVGDKTEAIADAGNLTAFPHRIVNDTRISTNPSGTKRMLALLILPATVFFLATQLFVRRSYFMFFAGVVALNGIALSIFGMVQAVTWNGKLFWTVELVGGGPFASFVNRNNAGGFLLMSLGCALVMTVWGFSRSGPDKKVRDAAYREMTKVIDKAFFKVRRFLAELSSTKVALMLGCAVIAGGVIATISRGSIVSLIAASVMTLAVSIVYNNRQFALPIIALTMLGVGGLAGWVGFDDDLTRRFSIINDQESLENEGRVKLWNDSLPAMDDYKVAGSGLGSFRYIHRSYLSFNTGAVFFYAENQYVQTLIEAGIPGLVLVILMLLVMTRHVVQVLKKGASARYFGIGIGVCFAIFSAAMHSLFDLDLYIPSNAVLLAAIAGGLVGLMQNAKTRQQKKQSKSKKPAKQKKNETTNPKPSGKIVAFSAIPCMLLLFGLGVWAMVETMQDRKIDEAVVRAVRLENERTIPIAELDQIIEQLESATAKKRTTESTRALAQLWTLRYRRQFLGDMVTLLPSLGSLPEQQRWGMTSMISFYEAIGTSRESGSVDELLKNEVVADNLPHALKYFQQSFTECAYQPDVALRLTELSPMEPGAIDEREMLLIAIRLNPSNVEQQRVCGAVARLMGDGELAVECWRNVLEQDGSSLAAVIQLSRNFVDDEMFVERMIPEDPNVILKILQSDLRLPEDKNRRLLLNDKLHEVLSATELQAGEKNYLLAQGWFAIEDYEKASIEFKTALKHQPYRAEWRYQHAKLLLKAGDLSEAVKEAKQASNDKPDSREYRDFFRHVHKLDMPGVEFE